MKPSTMSASAKVVYTAARDSGNLIPLSKTPHPPTQTPDRMAPWMQVGPHALPAEPGPWPLASGSLGCWWTLGMARHLHAVLVLDCPQIATSDLVKPGNIVFPRTHCPSSRHLLDHLTYPHGHITISRPSHKYFLSRFLHTAVESTLRLLHGSDKARPARMVV